MERPTFVAYSFSGSFGNLCPAIKPKIVAISSSLEKIKFIISCYTSEAFEVLYRQVQPTIVYEREGIIREYEMRIPKISQTIESYKHSIYGQGCICNCNLRLVIFETDNPDPIYMESAILGNLNN